MLTQAQLDFLRKHLNKITWHWTAGNYSQTYTSYHFCITYDGKLAHVKQTRSLYEAGAHVYKRNTGNIGISMCGMAKGFPIEEHQVEVTAKLTAELMILFDIEIDDVQDHAFYAKADGYYPSRWDVGNLEPVLRKKTLWYLSKLQSGEHKREYTVNLK